MAKKVLSSSDFKKIVEKAWADADCDTEVFELNATKNVSCVDYLDISFYTYSTTVGKDSYALVKVEGDKDDTAAVDYADKTAKVTFAIPEWKANTLDFYVQRLRTFFAGKAQEFAVLKNSGLKAFLTFGTLQYENNSGTIHGATVFASMNVGLSFDRSNTAIKYEMALINNPFDDGTVNVRWFASQVEQQAWFQARINASQAPYSEIKAPNTSSLIIGSQTYYAPNTGDLNALLSYNYAVIKKTSASGVKFFYYYVTSASGGADNQIVVGLKLDTIQTYYFDSKTQFSDCNIDRVHLDRFIKEN